MKGLIRNNFYMVLGSIIPLSILGLILIVSLVITGFINYDIGPYLPMAIGGLVGGFGALVGTMAQKDTNSKWNRFELTLPVKRSDIMKSKYISSTLFICLGIMLSTSLAIIYYILFGGELIDRMIFTLNFSICFSLGLSAFFIPLITQFGTEKNELLLLISVALSLLLYFLFNMSFFKFMPVEMYGNTFIYTIILVITNIILLIMSYHLSTYIYSKKDI